MRCPLCNCTTLTETHGYGHGIQELPGWRCADCGIKIVVTNPSYLPAGVWKAHPTCKRRAIAYGGETK
ncbi:hypothetical protein LCGC14_1682770 [marine sediment metagenome]|uniref:Uncharacterized protein n=1 Tax=marine sediment metagenome TaxID=412755 RepID=A0A0F9KN43_9ZZZZ